MVEPIIPSKNGKNTHGTVALWQHIFGDGQGLLAICHGNGQSFKTAFFNYPDSATPAAEFAHEKAETGRNVWFCTHLLDKPKRIKQYATAIRALWGDLDGASVPNGGLKPTAVVQSSPGHFHCYWRLADPIPPEIAEGLNKRLATTIGGDPSGFDLTQLLRVPDTTNHKYPEKPVVEMMALDSHLIYTAGGLDRMLPEPPEEVHTPKDVGDVVAEGSRNETLTSLAGTLRRRGLDADSISAALSGINTQKCEPPLPETEVARIAHSVARYEPPANPMHSSQSRSQSLGNKVMSYDREHSITAVSFRGRAKPGPREWIVEKAICKGHPASWYGEGGIAKSLLAAHLGLHVAADGVDYWAGLRIKTAPVVYGDFELDEDEHLRRAQELSAGMGLPDVPAKFKYLPLNEVPITDAFEIAAYECERLKAGLFILDSVGYALQGDSELAKDVLRFYREHIQPIRSAGTTPLLIDHQAKVIKGEKYSDKMEFGSVYKTNSVRSSFQIRGGWDGDELTATFTHKKTNFGPKVPSFSLLVRFEDELISVSRMKEAVLDPDRAPSKKEQVLAAAEELGRLTSETVADETGIPTQTVRNSITELEREGLLVDTGDKEGRFRVFVTPNFTT